MDGHVILYITALLASSCGASVSLRRVVSRDPPRVTMNFYDPNTASETVMGYREGSESEDLHVTDVAQITRIREDNYTEFSVLADEIMLGEPRHKSIEGLPGATPGSPSSLKFHLMSRLSSQILHEYDENVEKGSVLYCARQALDERYDEFGRNELVVRYTIYLSRQSPEQPYQLKALKAELATLEDKVVKPKFNAEKLHELVSNSEIATPRMKESPSEICSRQVEFYSNYISPFGGAVVPDVWPYPVESSSYPLTTGQRAVNIFHWLTDGTMKVA